MRQEFPLETVFKTQFILDSLASGTKEVSPAHYWPRVVNLPPPKKPKGIKLLSLKGAPVRQEEPTSPQKAARPLATTSSKPPTKPQSPVKAAAPAPAPTNRSSTESLPSLFGDDTAPKKSSPIRQVQKRMQPLYETASSIQDAAPESEDDLDITTTFMQQRSKRKSQTTMSAGDPKDKRASSPAKRIPQRSSASDVDLALDDEDEDISKPVKEPTPYNKEKFGECIHAPSFSTNSRFAELSLTLIFFFRRFRHTKTAGRVKITCSLRDSSASACQSISGLSFCRL